MDTSYELWNVETGNIIGAFATEDEALTIVRQLVDSYGQSYALELTLGRRETGYQATILGEGNQLLVMLERSTADTKRDPGSGRRAD